MRLKIYLKHSLHFLTDQKKEKRKEKKRKEKKRKEKKRKEKK